jgi:hypothetical protein
MRIQPRTGAERYLARQLDDDEYRSAQDEARLRIDQVDAAMRAVEARGDDPGDGSDQGTSP